MGLHMYVPAGKAECLSGHDQILRAPAGAEEEQPSASALSV
jgi:hypothetical protein